MTQALDEPILLFNDACAVCRVIAHWVMQSAEREMGGATLIVRPIGTDPVALRAMNPGLDIWDAYANIHLLMQDGSMKTNGEAVAETLRNLPNTRWLARAFQFSFLGRRPFQSMLDVAYTILADSRPLLGCESCGIPPPWLRPFHWMAQQMAGKPAAKNHSVIAATTVLPGS
ncbi:Protein of unknown function, DUF393 [Bryocella elongata]|uniref:DUF393 domain-containing protein n=1 Tax=Bryocella elongata TaxID=863522 RepID=A0A1H5S1P7_9BACT|nr:DCC1-like thiol-disulfide oxidoreductase family protein [Bryocella elongata]SEF43757.1 Protein of unknown function, DUF393 [Bryocella elongata]